MTIAQLTPQQESLINSYREKWKAISLSTERINQEKALLALAAAHKLYPEGPFREVLFFDSPYALFHTESLRAVSGSLTLTGEGQVRDDLWFDLDMSWNTYEKIRDNLEDSAGSRIYEQLWEVLYDWFCNKLRIELSDNLALWRDVYNNFIYRDSEWAMYPGLFDFCFNELNSQCDREQLDTYLAVVRECGWWFLPTPQYFFVCDRPTKILLDEEERLHTEEEPAIQFSDGFGVYARHGEVTSVLFPKSSAAPQKQTVFTLLTDVEN